jgi:hypothetical protein
VGVFLHCFAHEWSKFLLSELSDSL